MIDPSPDRVTWYYGEWQSAHENLDISNLHLEGLPTSFDDSKRNIVVLDDLMAETDERVTNLFQRKATTVIHPSYISCKTCFQKTRRVAPLVWTHSTEWRSRIREMCHKWLHWRNRCTLVESSLFRRRSPMRHPLLTGTFLSIWNRTPPRIYGCARPYYRAMLFSMYTCQKYI